jgi:DNA-binding NtrC family response regulator
MKKLRIFLADEDEALRQNLKRRLLGNGFEVLEAFHKTDVLRFIQSRDLDLAILGSSRNGARDGLEVVKQIRHRDRVIPLILINRQSSEARAIAAFRAGVNDYFKRPFSYQELLASIDRHLSGFSRQQSASHKADLPHLDNHQLMIGVSQSMRKIKLYLAKVALTDCTVLITGETGTGKELAADLIHRNSPRRQRPFVSINCAALPESLVESELFGYERGAFTGAVTSKQGKFELADGGTLLLDEIGDMGSYAQAKILRTIERKETHRLGGKKGIPLDVRVVAATNQDPERMVGQGKFREDLYYRLNVARVHLPPLPHRKEDLLPLIEHYIQEFNQRFGREVEGLTEEALAILFQYGWPGNVRELKNLLEASFVDLPSRLIAFADLPEMFQKRLRDAEGLPENDRDRVLYALLTTKWNKSRAAQKLHCSRMTLYRKMAKYHIVKGGETGHPRKPIKRNM